mmetsp:Transcript_4275/g.3586  ORF Transcript_4275/g.3586 Transcript_4275/m.3586 type:complete len:221 (-) Transcript_4275:46-708(-)
MSSGSFNKMKAFEKPLLKNNRSKYNHKFLVERKQINLQSSKPRKLSKSKQPSLNTSRDEVKDVFSIKNSRNPKPVLRRTRTGLPAMFKNTFITRNSNLNHKSINQSGTSKITTEEEAVGKRKKMHKDRSVQLLQKITLKKLDTTLKKDNRSFLPKRAENKHKHNYSRLHSGSYYGLKKMNSTQNLSEFSTRLNNTQSMYSHRVSTKGKLAKNKSSLKFGM